MRKLIGQALAKERAADYSVSEAARRGK